MYYLNQARDWAGTDICSPNATNALLAGILHALIAIAESAASRTETHDE